MPRLRVFVAAVNQSNLLGDLSSIVTQRTLICPLLELLVRGSLLHKIENLNIMGSERVVFTDGGHMHLIVQLGISKRPCFSSGVGIRHLEQLFLGPSILGRMDESVEASADQSNVPLRSLSVLHRIH
jgi:hypothetical protein